MSNTRQLTKSVPTQLNELAKRIKENPEWVENFLKAMAVTVVAIYQINALSEKRHASEVERFGEATRPAAKFYPTEKFIFNACFIFFVLSTLALLTGDKLLKFSAALYSNRETDKKYPKIDNALRFGFFYLEPKQTNQETPTQAPAPRTP